MMLAAALLAGRLAAPRPVQSVTESVPTRAAHLIALGDQAVRSNDLRAALQDYKKADSAARHRCVSCLLRLSGAEREAGDSGAALKAAQRAVAAAAGRPVLAAAAETQAGDLLSARAGLDHPKRGELRQAAAAYRAALAETPGGASDAALQFKLDVIRIREGRQAEGLAGLRSLAAHPDASAGVARQAREIVATPQLAFEQLPPEFRFTADDGHSYSNKALRGKVVLIDFWASWCPPCRDAAPMIQGVQERFGKDPDFLLVGVSADNSNAAMKSFVKNHHLSWPEYRDQKDRIENAFGVSGIPTYVVLRRDGSIAFFDTGLDYNFYGTVPSGRTWMALRNVIERELRGKKHY